ncbi:MAG: tyrosine--tRNA ligase, partial [Gemmatimonadota bacterium]
MPRKSKGKRVRAGTARRKAAAPRRSFPPVPEQMDRIRAGAVEVIPEEALARKLEDSRARGVPLVVKQGFDPTRPDLHLGHAVSIRKLKDFQELGHDVVFVIGDFTALVGDPSGQSETRPALSEAEIRENLETYESQVFQILDRNRTRIERNSRWLGRLRVEEILALTARYTVARLLERDDFAQRHREGRPISVVEFLYPLLQAYDSVALDADVELGGTDQKFNLLVARAIQERYGQDPQACVILPLLRGTDGELKMSKSYANYVGIAEPPEDQYGKTMSIPDALLEEWIRLVSTWRGEVQASQLRNAALQPLDVKRALARNVVE